MDVIRENPEILRINEKMVTIEAGIIVNAEELTVKELIAVNEFLYKTIHSYTIANFNKILKYEKD